MHYPWHMIYNRKSQDAMVGGVSKCYEYIIPCKHHICHKGCQTITTPSPMEPFVVMIKENYMCNRVNSVAIQFEF